VCVFVADHVGSEEDDENIAALGLGELADLTVFNEADTSSYDVRILTLCSPSFPTVICGVKQLVVCVGEQCPLPQESDGRRMKKGETSRCFSLVAVSDCHWLGDQKFVMAENPACSRPVLLSPVQYTWTMRICGAPAN